MLGTTRRVCLVISWLTVQAAVTASGQEPLRSAGKGQKETAAVSATQPQSVPLGSSNMLSLPKRAKTAESLKTLETSKIQRIGGAGAISGGGFVTPVYLNEFFPPDGQSLSVFVPGTNQRLADDLELEDTSGPITSYSYAVGGIGSPGAPTTFQVESKLWTGDPCVVGSTIIQGTQHTETGLANDGTVFVIDVPLSSPASIPPTIDGNIIWMSLTFDNLDVGWVIALEAEIGYTRDLFSEDDTEPGGFGCALLFFGGNPLAGFWAGVNTELSRAPVGACCRVTSCSQTTEGACSGTWQGAFSSCSPNPCVTGACCGGSDFLGCDDTSEAGCARSDGQFYPGVICAVDTCPQQFNVYCNDRAPVGVFAPGPDDLFADDQTMAAGAPCELSRLEAEVLGFAFTGSFDVVMELWTVNPDDSLPLAPISGTRAVFNDVGDGAFQSLVAPPYSGIVVPPIVFMVLSFTTPDGRPIDTAGWVIGGIASVGDTQDFFFLRQSGTWGAFDFVDDSIWSGMLAKVACYGTAPLGACCNDSAGTCIDDITERDCIGRWAEDVACTQNPFDPPCGTSACCIQFACQDRTPDECIGMGGEASIGQFCSDLDPVSPCPRIECTGASGNCLVNNGTPGCDNGFCCEAVCQLDPLCCTASWDVICASEAAAFPICVPPPPGDLCSEHIAISDEGTFSFDTTSATTDGLPHSACTSSLGNDGQVAKDVWRCWTAPCDGLVFVRTCGKTLVDSKIAVYEGCDNCPPGDVDLLFCNDDFCGFDQPDGIPLQSQAVFVATAGRSYKIRIGVFPGGGDLEPAAGGPGAITISCGLPDVDTCPGAGDCCSEVGTESASCDDDTCCRTVCACDAFCCEVEWDGDCATNGFDNSGCGAGALCNQACGPGCPTGPVVFVDPRHNVVDARQPFPPDDPSTRHGIGTLFVDAPSADPACWSICETDADGSANSISNIIDHGDGSMTIELARSITTNAVTVLTYTDDLGGETSGRLNAHHGNANGDGVANAADVLAAIDYANGASPPWGIYSYDADHSGERGPGDPLAIIDALNGGGSIPANMGTAAPDCGICCPR